MMSDARMTNRRVACAALLLTLVACSEKLVLTEIIDVPPTGEIYHAVYPGGVTGAEDDITLADLTSYEQAAGKSATWVYFSNNWYASREFPIATAVWIRDAGAIPFIRLMMRSSPEQNVAEPLFTLDRIASGIFDDDLRAWARVARDYSAPLLAEWGTEVNGSWFPWNGMWNGGSDGPARFRDAYRHIITVMRAEGAHNVLWVFHVNANDVPNVSWNRLENYYPGDDYIDWLGVSIYGPQTPFDEEATSFRQSMDSVYARLVGMNTPKPIAVLEFGATAGNPHVDQAAWADSALTDLVGGRWPRVIGFAWWNEKWQNDDNPAHDTNMRLQDNPALAAVFQRLVGGNPAVRGLPVVTDTLRK